MSLKKVLNDFKDGKITLEEAEKRVKLFEISQVSDFGMVDVSRESRTGLPEVVYGEKKGSQQLLGIVGDILQGSGRCVITRLGTEKADLLEREYKEGYMVERYREPGMVVVKARDFELPPGGRVAVLTAGTSDIPPAREAEVIAREMGCRVTTFYDIGVAGLHRLFPAMSEIVEEGVDCIVVAAGMEGALPSVVAGLVDIPVIGLPVSSGYGMGGEGRSALYSMLQSCSPGLSTVNIDNGFGAGVMAGLIANRVERFRRKSARQ